jgi:hypothetical protein
LRSRVSGKIAYHFPMHTKLNYAIHTLASLRKMPKKVVIEASLVEEADEVSDVDIEGTILKELSSHPPKIPWMETIKKVNVKPA